MLLYCFKNLKLYLVIVLLALLSSAIHAQKVDRISDFLNVSEFGQLLDPEDIIITDDYQSQGVRHTYYKRAIHGLTLFNSYAALHSNGKIQIEDSRQLAVGTSLKELTNQFSFDHEKAFGYLAMHKKYAGYDMKLIARENNKSQRSTYIISNTAYGEVIIQKQFYLLTKRDLRAVYSIAIEEVSSNTWMNYFVDAQTGEIIYEISWTVECDHGTGYKHTAHSHNVRNSNTTLMVDSSYNVFAYPVESPNYGTRSIQTTPWVDNLGASSNGWHQIGATEYTTTRGNNVDCYLDDDNTNSPTGGDAARVDGGANLNFDFPWSSSSDVTEVSDAALTNVFYWSNVIHDVWFNYGFDEQSGNFQEENLNGLGGNGSDYVRAEAQDGSGSCNANFGTPPDGSNPRMQMYLCNNRDGDFDNGVIVHEYGHGISNRLTGGPAASGCLGNQEQMGEGWSDWFGLMMTIEAGDISTDSRPIGTWLFNQGPNGNGIRPYPYTTDMNVNPMTYATVSSGVSVPHGVGSVWCTMLWDLTWSLIDEHGYDSDIYNGAAGNNIAMALVIEGLKLQVCNPGFVDGRDAIVAADQMLYNGDNECLIWEVFANRGLGYSANQGSTGSVSDGTEAFDLPPTCTLQLLKSSDKVEALAGDTIEYMLTSTNFFTEDQTGLIVKDNIPTYTTFIDATDSGALTDDTVSWSAVDLMIGEVVDYSFRVEVDENIDPVVDDIFDDMESGTSNFVTQNSGSTQWELQSTTVFSGSNTWKAVDAGSTGSALLQIAMPLGVGDNTKVKFTHFYDTEVQWDGGTVEISVDEGKSWQDLGDHFTINGYNNTIFNSRPGFSGDSGGFITSEIDLSAYSGQVALVRFHMNCDAFVGGNGWYIDDVFVSGLHLYIPNIAISSTNLFNALGVLDTPTRILVGPNDLVVEGESSDLSCHDGNDGQAAAIPSGGDNTYTYLWSTGSTDSLVTTLTAGAHFVDVTSEMITRRKYFFIAEPIMVEANVTKSDAIGGDNGSLTANPTGGTESYTYLWSTGSTDQMISDLAPGSYTVTVTDTNLCESIETKEIIDLVEECQNKAYLFDMQFDQFPSDVEVELRSSDNTLIANYTFTDEPSGFATQKLVCLVNDCYTITINDLYGDGVCANYSSPVGFIKFSHYASGHEFFDICDFNTYTYDFCVGPLEGDITSTYPSCPGVSDGELTVVPDLGNYDYTYLWSTGATTSTIDNLLAGTYTVTVSDGMSQIIVSENLINGNSRVFNNNDNGIGSLRAAIENGCPTDTITLEPTLVGDTISLLSEIIVDKAVHIEGLGMFGLYITGNNQFRIFHNTGTGVLSLRSMTLLEAFSNSNGGAIYNQGILNVESMMIKDNFEGASPKAFSNEGTINVKGIVDIR